MFIFIAQTRGAVVAVPFRASRITVLMLACLPLMAQVDNNRNANEDSNTLSAPAQGRSEPQDASRKTTPAPQNDDRDRVFYPGDTERLRPLGRKLLANIMMDQKEIWTSPFRMHSKDAKWWIGFGALTATLIATDRHTANIFENSPGQISWGKHVSRIGASYTLIPLVSGFYGYGVLRDDSKPREVGVLGAEALLDSLIVVQVLKPIGGRIRPDSKGEKAQFFDGGDSFPSGHAITSWSLASLIAHEYGHGHGKLVPVLAYALASVASTARFAAQRHYASDIVAGSAMGWFIGRYVYQTHMDHALHQHGWLHRRIAPNFQPAQHLYGIALRFGD